MIERPKMDIEWKCSRFSELSIDELYAILHHRFDVFVVEQKCFYLDTDYKDQEAYHLQGFMDGKLIAYCRIFPKGVIYKEGVAIGRVLVSQDSRKLGVGHKLVQEALRFISEEMNESRIDISAQCYLQAFYEGYGFQTHGEQYMDAGVSHIHMTRIEDVKKMV